jgi:hypothetical protein
MSSIGLLLLFQLDLLGSERYFNFMNTRSTRGSSSSESFYFLVLVAAVSYFVADRQFHYFDAPALKDFRLGMTLRDFKDIEDPTQVFNYAKSGRNVICIRSSTENTFTVAGVSAAVNWYFYEGTDPQPKLYEISAAIWPPDGGTQIYSQLVSKYWKAEKKPLKREDGVVGFSAEWNICFWRYSVRLEAYPDYSTLTLLRKGTFDDVQKQGSGPVLDI